MNNLGEANEESLQSYLSELGAWCSSKGLIALSTQVQQATDSFVALLQDARSLDSQLDGVQSTYARFQASTEQLRTFMGAKEALAKTLKEDYRSLDSVDMKEDKVSQFEVHIYCCFD